MIFLAAFAAGIAVGVWFAYAWHAAHPPEPPARFTILGDIVPSRGRLARDEGVTILERTPPVLKGPRGSTWVPPPG